jgi:seryl-tRNA(Sec) selenium transferase
MLAFKLPISLYEKYMKEAHHDAPLREEEKLSDTAEFLEQQARTSKSRLTMGDGNMEIGQQREAQFDLS